MADRLAATGVLLVGGASERFGSPKALARFRGETLAERAWRTLGRGVRRGASPSERRPTRSTLPFPVLDDGADERAPVFGVIAGLRAAAHDTCVVLPVDCPLVTPELLGELIGASAVPTSGPLPGAYHEGAPPRARAASRAWRALAARRQSDDDRGGRRPARSTSTRRPTSSSRRAARSTMRSSIARSSRRTTIAFSGAREPTSGPPRCGLRGKLRKGEVFVAVDSVNGAMKRSLVTLLELAAHCPSTPRRRCGTTAGDSSAGPMRARSPRSRVHMRITTFATRRAPCGKRSTSSRAREGDCDGGSASTRRSIARSCAGGSAAIVRDPRPGLPYGREACAASCRCCSLLCSLLDAATTHRRDDTSTTADTASVRVYFLRDGKVWPGRVDRSRPWPICRALANQADARRARRDRPSRTLSLTTEVAGRHGALTSLGLPRSLRSSTR